MPERRRPVPATAATDATQTLGWRRGHKTRARVDLVPHLLEAGRHHAQAAVRDFSDPDGFVLLDAAIHVGGAIEMVAKAAIAREEPLLLAKPSGRGDLLDAFARLRETRLTPSPGWRLKSIDVTFAIELLDRIHPNLGSRSAAAKEALNARNDAAHMGIVVPDELEKAAAAMVTYINALLGQLGEDERSFWDQAYDQAAALEKDREERLKLRAEELIREARARFDHWLARLGPDPADIAEALAERELENQLRRPDFDDIDVVSCPACTCNAMIPKEIDVEEDFDGDGHLLVWGFTKLGLECPVCDLRLSAEEAQALGVLLTHDGK